LDPSEGSRQTLAIEPNRGDDRDIRHCATAPSRRTDFRRSRIGRSTKSPFGSVMPPIRLAVRVPPTYSYSAWFVNAKRGLQRAAAPSRGCVTRETATVHASGRNYDQRDERAYQLALHMPLDDLRRVEGLFHDAVDE